MMPNRGSHGDTETQGVAFVIIISSVFSISSIFSGFYSKGYIYGFGIDINIT